MEENPVLKIPPNSHSGIWECHMKKSVECFCGIDDFALRRYRLQRFKIKHADFVM